MDRGHLLHAYICQFCKGSFDKMENLNKHIAQIHTPSASTKENRVCPICGLCLKTDSYPNHLRHIHGHLQEGQVFTFKCYNDFIAWKTELEKRNYCKYLAKHGVKKLASQDKIHVYQCDGMSRLPRAKRGAVVIRDACPSMIAAIESVKTQSVKIEFWDMHVGHSLPIGEEELEDAIGSIGNTEILLSQEFHPQDPTKDSNTIFFADVSDDGSIVEFIHESHDTFISEPRKRKRTPKVKTKSNLDVPSKSFSQGFSFKKDPSKKSGSFGCSLASVACMKPTVKPTPEPSTSSDLLTASTDNEVPNEVPEIESSASPKMDTNIAETEVVVTTESGLEDNSVVDLDSIVSTPAADATSDKAVLSNDGVDNKDSKLDGAKEKMEDPQNIAEDAVINTLKSNSEITLSVSTANDRNVAPSKKKRERSDSSSDEGVIDPFIPTVKKKRRQSVKNSSANEKPIFTIVNDGRLKGQVVLLNTVESPRKTPIGSTLFIQKSPGKQKISNPKSVEFSEKVEKMEQVKESIVQNGNGVTVDQEDVITLDLSDLISSDSKVDASSSATPSKKTARKSISSRSKIKTGTAKTISKSAPKQPILPKSTKVPNAPSVSTTIAGAPLNIAELQQANNLQLNSFPPGQTFVAINNNLYPISNPGTATLGSSVNPGSILLTSSVPTSSLLRPAFTPSLLRPAVTSSLLRPAAPSSLLRPAAPSSLLRPAAPSSLLRPAAPSPLLRPARSLLSPATTPMRPLNAALAPGPVLRGVLQPQAGAMSMMLVPNLPRPIRPNTLPGVVLSAPAFAGATSLSSTPVGPNRVQPIISTPMVSSSVVQPPASKSLLSPQVLPKGQIPSSPQLVQKSPRTTVQKILPRTSVQSMTTTSVSTVSNGPLSIVSTTVSNEIQVQKVQLANTTVTSSNKVSLCSSLVDQAKMSTAVGQKPGTLFFESAGDLYMLEPVEEGATDKDETQVSDPTSKITETLDSTKSSSKGLISSKPGHGDPKVDVIVVSPSNIPDMKNGIQIQSVIQDKRPSKDSDMEILQKVKYYQLEMKYLAAQAECKKLKLELAKAVMKNKECEELKATPQTFVSQEEKDDSTDKESKINASTSILSDLQVNLPSKVTSQEDSQVDANDNPSINIDDSESDTPVVEKRDPTSQLGTVENDRERSSSNEIEDHEQESSDSMELTIANLIEKLNDDNSSKRANANETTIPKSDPDTHPDDSDRPLEGEAPALTEDAPVNSSEDQMDASSASEAAGDHNPSAKETLVMDDNNKDTDEAQTMEIDPPVFCDPGILDDELLAESSFSTLSFEETIKALETQNVVNSASSVYTMIRSSVLRGLYTEMQAVCEKHKKLIEKFPIRRHEEES